MVIVTTTWRRNLDKDFKQIVETNEIALKVKESQTSPPKAVDK